MSNSGSQGNEPSKMPAKSKKPQQPAKQTKKVDKSTNENSKHTKNAILQAKGTGKASTTPGKKMPSKKSFVAVKLVNSQAKSAEKKKHIGVPPEKLEFPKNLSSRSTAEIKELTQRLARKISTISLENIKLGLDIKNLEAMLGDSLIFLELQIPPPYLVSTVVEILHLPKSNESAAGREGSNVNEDSMRSSGVVLHTSRRNVVFLPVVGLVNMEDLKPNDLVGCQKETKCIIEKLPDEFDHRIKGMEIGKRPQEQPEDIGGLEKEMQELNEAVVWPLTKKHLFKKLGITPPKGALLFGEPGTGKTMLARMVASQTDCTFIQLAGSQVVQTFVGDGAKMVRDIFKLARKKAPTIIFIDEIDALATKRFNTERAGDREAQRTMLELLSQMDGFQPDDDIKIIAATNRVETLDPALLRSGRLDRKIKLPMPDEQARERIIKIHSKKMTVDTSVVYLEVARAATEFNGAQCRAICTEAGMLAVRRNQTVIKHEDFMDAVLEVMARKKIRENFYS